MNNKPKISINILGWNHKDVLAECFKHAQAQDYVNYEILYIDNASGDGSEEFVRQNFLNIKVIQTGKNLGYSGGHNIGIKNTDAEFICFLNPDVKLEPNFLSEAIEPMLINEKIAGVGGKLWQRQENGKKIIDTTGIIIQHSRRAYDRGQYEQDNGQYDTAGEIFAVNGACPLYRKSALNHAAIDGEILDEHIFAYWDDVDLCWRLRLLGYKIWYQPTATAWHERLAGRSQKGYSHVGEFVKHHKKLSSHVRKLNWKNHLFIIVKNDFGWPLYRDLPAVLAREFFMIIYIILFEIRTLGAVPQFMRQLPKMLKKRRKIAKLRQIKASEINKWLTFRWKLPN